VSRAAVAPSRRKPNPQQRRRELCDAAIGLLAEDGARGLSHLKVDQRAAVPNGTTSFYFRTRAALLRAAAARVAELDLADLNSLPTRGDTAPSSLARLVMKSASEPGLSRTKARYELALQAIRDPVVAGAFQENVFRFVELSRHVVQRWQPVHTPPDPALVEDQAVATMTFIDGVLMSFVRGGHAIRSAEQLDRLIRGIISGITQMHQPG
jgi:DNA-binding transcriptional regulator YbjK